MPWGAPGSGDGRVDGVALDGAGHAAGAAAAAAEFLAGDRDDLDAVLPQESVGRGVALVAEDHAGSDGEEVVAVVPLLALRAEQVDRRPHHTHLLDADRLGDDGEELGVLGDLVVAAG